MIRTRKHSPLITGTIILTLTGFASRFIGFFYRIFLSRLFGAEGMGIYQLISPVLALSFSLTVAGMQTAISKYVANETITKDYKSSALHLSTGFVLSMAVSILCALGIYCFADKIALYFLLEARTAPLLRIIALSIPMATVHSCINGYFYGIKKAGIPAGAQLLEQIARVGCVYIASSYYVSIGISPSINVAVLGLTVGEFFSMIMTLLAVRPHGMNSGILLKGSGRNILSHGSRSAVPGGFLSSGALYGKLLSMALPLTANRIVLNLLQSVESVSIPSMLKGYGYDNTTALSVYGVFTGMAMPFIFFPNAITSSVAVLLLPIISENYALGNMAEVKKATLRTVKYCGLMGGCCMCVFVFLGKWLGTALFHSPLAGYFITTLGFICPFLYLDTTLSSILQGLGLAGHIFVMNVICLLVRLGFVFFAIPRFGITGYLWGLLASQLLLGLLYLGCLYRLQRKKC